MHNSFETKLSKFIEDKNISKTLSEQGKIFEKLTKKILQIEPTFLNELKEVYMWGEFATKFNVDGRDIGIDLMARTHKDEWISVQCKDFQFSHRLSEGDLKGFLGLHNIEDKNGKKIIEISYRYVFHTCKTTTDHFIKSCNQASTPVKIYGFYELENLNLDWNSLKDTDINTLQVSKQKKLRPYQKEALEAIKGHFLDKNEARAKVIMACGTGKSLLSIRIIDSIVSESEIALFFAPSLALINQMLREFFRESQSESYKVFAVCSDSKVGNDEDLRAKDIDIPVISSPSNLNKHITHYLKENKKIIIFSTYQSIDIVTQAQKLFKKEIKLIINDEAHRTAGYEKLSAESEKILSLWQKTHNNEFLNAKYRLYLTATPRVFSDKTKEKTKEKELNLFSMDDEDIFGKEIFSFDFNKAVEGGFLCDYKVIITFINKDSIDFSKLLTVKNKNFKIEDISQMLGLYKAICKEDLYLLGDENKTLSPFENDKDSMKRIVSFHSSINNSKFLKKNFCILDKNLDETMTEHIDGTDNASVKNAKLSWLKNDDEANFKILSNAKCLTEGIDVPSLDGVCFFDPRDSVVDIIQAVGRVMRKAPSKKYGYIILPIVLSDKEIKTHEKSLNSKGFKNIWKVLKAIRSHDERLVDPQRISEVVKISSSKNAGGFERDTNETVKNQLFSLHELANEIKNAVPEKLGDANYWELYAKKVGPTMQDLTLRIEELLRNKKEVNALFESFTKALQDNLNVSFVKSEALALIAQHIITKPIFSHIFPHIDFTKFDKVSFELERFYKELCKFGLQDELKNLKKFYANVQKSAEYAQSDEAKQNLIKSLYENLFKAAFKKTQEKLGIVYTPIELVDFIIYSLEFVLKKHFDKSLSDKGVNIYDPFTGTGTFITRLIQSGLLDKNLEHKYKNELWANEITLLGYYIAQINITAIMHQRLKELDPKKDEFILLDNLLFTDTFNTYTQDSKGFKGDTKLDFKAKYFTKNYAKINELKKTEFKVIMGNPPYSANQNSSNDNNANTSYPTLEKRVQETYIKKSNSTYTGKVYDTLKMAIRYASDRIEKDGVIGFVTNGSFISGNSDDGLRACLEEEFDAIYIFNLRGNQRTSGELSRKEGGKIFDSGSRTPVAISILIKDSKMRKAKNAKASIYYYDIGDYLNREEKLNIISDFESIEGIKAWQKITPNKDYDWINQRDYSFMELIPLGNVKTKLKPLNKENSTMQLEIFKIFSQGVVTNRDEWCINFSKKALETNMVKMIKNYNAEVDKKEKIPNYTPDMDKTRIKWTRDLLNSFAKNKKFSFYDSGLILSSHYRPFTKCHLYLAKHFNEMLYQMPQLYPAPQTQNIEILSLEAEAVAGVKEFFKTHKYLPNLSICISGVGGGKEFSALMSDSISEMAFMPNSQCFPLYYYEKLEPKDLEPNLFSKQEVKKNTSYYKRKDAIRDEALGHFRENYKNSKITKEDIFYYIYALLNHKGYIEKYKDSLSKMLPRLPLAKDFKEFVRLGSELARVHLNYEGFAKESESGAKLLKKDLAKEQTGLFAPNKLEVLKELENLSEEEFKITKLRFLIKGEKNSIIFNDKFIIENIPAKAYNYVVNGKSGIEWIMDRYQVKQYKDSQLTNDPNHYESQSGALKGLKGGKYVLYLLLSVIEMSVKSVDLIEEISKLSIEERL